MAEWRPQIEAGDGYIHERIAAALQADVARGLLAPGAKLPTHRRLAELLGVGVGAVTKAYAAAEDRGLVTAHVGRGSFIAQPAARGGDVASHQGPIDLAHNLPPAAPARARLAEALGRLRQRGDLLTYLDYPPTAGAEAHRRAASGWLAATANWPDLDWRRLIVTSGATVACTPSTVTAKVSGETSICGVPELRTMSFFPILRTFFTGMICRLSSSFLWTPASNPA